MDSRDVIRQLVQLCNEVDEFMLELDPIGDLHVPDRKLLLTVPCGMWKKVPNIDERLYDIFGDEEESSPKQERAKVTNGLRYEIMRRDGFHCVLCGATGKTAQLVVDHIQPVKLDGKTEPDNLRTLCFECNSGKADRVE